MDAPYQLNARITLAGISPLTVSSNFRASRKRDAIRQAQFRLAENLCAPDHQSCHRLVDDIKATLVNVVTEEIVWNWPRPAGAIDGRRPQWLFHPRTLLRREHERRERQLVES